MEKTRLYTQIALALALAVVLDIISKMLPLPRLPYGGSISLRTLPILVLAFRYGGKTGGFTGALYGVMDCILQPIIVHPAQFLLDYPVAFAGVGLAGLFRRRTGVANDATRYYIVAGILAGYGIRFSCHFLSGVIFFGHFAPAGQPIWLYSLVYNLSYLVPESLVAVGLTLFILPRLPRQGVPRR